MAESLNYESETCTVVSPEEITYLQIVDQCENLAWNPNGDSIAIAFQNSIHIWNLNLNKLETKINLGGTIRGKMKWNYQGTVLVFGNYVYPGQGNDPSCPNIWTWRARNDEYKKIGDGYMIELEWNPCGTFFLTTEFEKKCSLWNSEKTGQPTKIFLLGDQAWSVAWKSDSIFAVGLCDTIHIYQINSDEPIRILRDNSDYVVSMEWSSFGGDLLASGSKGGSVKVWCNYECLPSWENGQMKGEAITVRWIDISSTDAKLVSISEEELKIWSLRGECMAVYEIEEVINVLPILSPNGCLFLSNCEVRCTFTNKLEKRIPESMNTFRQLQMFNKKGDRLAIYAHQLGQKVGILNLGPAILKKGSSSSKLLYRL